MNEQIQRLMALQDVETRLRQKQRDLDCFPAMLSEARKPLEAAKEAVAGLEARVLELQAIRRDREGDLEAELAKVRRMKDRTSGIKTNKEYYAHLKEIEVAQKACSALEDEILQVMEEQERMAGGVLEDARAGVSEEQRRFAASEQTVRAEMAEADAGVDSLRRERQAHLESLDPLWRAQYERLLSATKGLVVVEAFEGTCTGCRMNLPPQVYNDVRKNDDVVTCPYCHRILFMSEKSAADRHGASGSGKAQVSNQECV